MVLGVWRDGHENTLKLRPDGSMFERVEAGIGKATRHEFKTEEEKDRELSAAFYFESLGSSRATRIPLAEAEAAAAGL